MATALSTTCFLSWRNHHQVNIQPSPLQNGVQRASADSVSKGSCLTNEESQRCSTLSLVNRRAVLASGVCLLGFPGECFAVVKQGLLAGRIPGLSEPDEKLFWNNIVYPCLET